MTETKDDKLPKSSRSLKVLSYNCGMLRLKLFGVSMFTVFENPPYVSARFPHLAKTLLESGADVLVLQEVYEPSHVSQLKAVLKEVYPYVNERNTTFLINFTNGLILFSKYPIKDGYIQVHKKSARLEYIMGSKSMQVVVIESPLGDVQLLNMHTTAGGDLDPENPAVDGIRESELNEALDASKKYLEESDEHRGMSIILGDLNMGPEVSPGNYDHVLNKGYVDAVKESILGVGASREADLSLEEWGTWDPENLLNKGGIHGDCKKQRIDLVFIPKDSPLAIRDVSIFKKDPYIPIKKGKKEMVCTQSDHYGLAFEIYHKGN